ncbi:efflux RND transporter periplasmic adaptor subunit [Streptococcus entericus]|uniref:efflux RND transporter periplasmic adaptor subunit n=1 Tax=Streptococcus entericus TaxID=155680 RepID=UPI0003614253|nr:efflux RND transporter periplasmic adaptor subunit [Streptococcus entericus]
MTTKKKNPFQMSKKTWGIVAGLIGVTVLGGYFLLGRGSAGQGQEMVEPYQIAQVTEGSIASSKLLTGTVKALSEQKLYFDSSKGEISEFHINVGDKVTVGQPLVQYSTKTAQAAYDQAVRALNKIGRQIYDLRTYGLPATETVNEDGSVSSNVAEVQRSADNQLADLNDAYASAQQDVDKAKEALDKLLETSKVEGTVVEVNRSIDPSKTGGQVVVHIVSEGQLQVEGMLTEYDLATTAVDQDVKLTSKVFPDKSWSGKISYISNYPSESDASTPSTGTGNSANYPFKVDFIGDTAGLKQGFKVNIEVTNKAVNKLVPTGAIVAEGEQSYVWIYDKATGKLSKATVSLGRSDALNQEVTEGLETEQTVIANPSPEFKDGQTLKPEEVIDLSDFGTEASSDKQ